LTAVLPLLAHRDLDTFWKMLRLWTVVLSSNLAGTLAIAWVLAHTSAIEAPIRDAFGAIAGETMGQPFGTVLLRGVFAGWILALIVWLLPAAPGARLWIIILMTWLVAAGKFSHIVAGSLEAMYLATTGAASWGQCLGGYMLPTLLGNILGGVSLVAALNHAQVVSGKSKGPHAEHEKPIPRH
jgi:formate/nitrite transporter FocA (FNT family)